MTCWFWWGSGGVVRGCGSQIVNEHSTYPGFNAYVMYTRHVVLWYLGKNEYHITVNGSENSVFNVAYLFLFHDKQRTKLWRSFGRSKLEFGKICCLFVVWDMFLEIVTLLWEAYNYSQVEMDSHVSMSCRNRVVIRKGVEILCVTIQQAKLTSNSQSFGSL